MWEFKGANVEEKEELKPKTKTTTKEEGTQAPQGWREELRRSFVSKEALLHSWIMSSSFATIILRLSFSMTTIWSLAFSFISVLISSPCLFMVSWREIKQLNHKHCLHFDWVWLYKIIIDHGLGPCALPLASICHCMAKRYEKYTSETCIGLVDYKTYLPK